MDTVWKLLVYHQLSLRKISWNSSPSLVQLNILILSSESNLIFYFFGFLIQNDESLLCCYKVWWASVHCLCDVQGFLFSRNCSFQFASHFSVNRIQCTRNRTRSGASRATFHSAFTGTNNSASLSSKGTSTVWLQSCFLSFCLFSIWLVNVVCDVCVE